MDREMLTLRQSMSHGCLQLQVGKPAESRILRIDLIIPLAALHLGNPGPTGRQQLGRALPWTGEGRQGLCDLQIQQHEPARCTVRVLRRGAPY